MLHTHTRCCHGTIVTDVRTIPLGPYPLLWPVPGFAHSQLMPLPRVVAAFPPVGHEGIAGQPESAHVAHVAHSNVSTAPPSTPGSM